MKQPLQITFRDIPRSDALETHIREKADKLDEFYEHIMGCHVVLEQPHGHWTTPNSVDSFYLPIKYP
jgi:ribosome-associated translation inhibitor RaiA